MSAAVKRRGTQADTGADIFEGTGHATKVAMIPARADVEAQEGFKKSLELRLEDAKSGTRAVFFIDAAQMPRIVYLHPF